LFTPIRKGKWTARKGKRGRRRRESKPLQKGMDRRIVNSGGRMSMLLLACRIGQRWEATRAAYKVLWESGTNRYRSLFCFLAENGQPLVTLS
jgi:hypothetical protein